MANGAFLEDIKGIKSTLIVEAIIMGGRIKETAVGKATWGNGPMKRQLCCPISQDRQINLFLNINGCGEHVYTSICPSFQLMTG